MIMAGVHTNLTSLWTPLRKHLRVDGESLVNIDVANLNRCCFAG